MRHAERSAAKGVLCVLVMVSAAGAQKTKSIMLTGYWPPTNDMLRRFSPNPKQNPNGWIGEDWEGRGYDIYAFFPEFPKGSWPIGEGDLEVDYQDTSQDWWPIGDSIQPVAIITFSRGFSDMSWEIEMNQFNRVSWIPDYTPPTQPTPSPPDDSVPADTLRPSTLPVKEIMAAVQDAGLGLDVFIDYDGDGGGFLSEFIAYHGVWYQDIHAKPNDAARSVAAGHIHVGAFVPVVTATAAAEVSLRTLIDYLDLILSLPGDMDHDGDVDLVDLGGFLECLSGPDQNPPLDCADADIDVDEDVDMADFQGFQLSYTGG